MIQTPANHSVFYRYSSYGKRIILIVCVDDIVITRGDHEGIAQRWFEITTSYRMSKLKPTKVFTERLNDFLPLVTFSVKICPTTPNSSFSQKLEWQELFSIGSFYTVEFDTGIYVTKKLAKCKTFRELLNMWGGWLRG